MDASTQESERGRPKEISFAFRHSFIMKKDAMLAKTYVASKFPWKNGTQYVQPKLDGVRALFCVSEGKLTSIESRLGNEFGHLLPIFRSSVERIASQLPHTVTVIDGELYRHGKSFQDLVSLVKNSNKDESKTLEFHVFDFIDDSKKGFADRYLSRRHLFDEDSKVKFVGIMGVAENAEEVDAFLTRAEADGYEGVMLRDGTTPYEPGKRSSSLHKAKRFDSNEFEIIAVNEATKKDAGTPVFECRANNGGKFSARPTGTMEERRKMWEAKDSYLGKMITVKYQGVSKDDIPRFPVAMGVRDYE